MSKAAPPRVPAENLVKLSFSVITPYSTKIDGINPITKSGGLYKFLLNIPSI